MFTFAYCRDSLMLVLLFTGEDSTDTEHERMIEAWRRLYEDAAAKPAIGVVVVARGHAPPNARWRRRIAEVQRRSRGPRRVAVVTTNPLIRAVITAVEWLAPPGPKQHTAAFATFDDAVRTLEAREGRSLDRLRALFADARKGAGLTGDSLGPPRMFGDLAP